VAFLFRRDAGYWRFWMDNRPLLFAARKVAEGEAPAPSADAPADDKAAKVAKPPAKKGGTMSMVHMESGRRDAVAKPAARPAEKRK
jgi:hypothetical protein